MPFDEGLELVDDAKIFRIHAEVKQIAGEIKRLEKKSRQVAGQISGGNRDLAVLAESHNLQAKIAGLDRRLERLRTRLSG